MPDQMPAPMPMAGRTPPGATGPATIAPPMDGRRMRGRTQATMALNSLEQSAIDMGGSQDEIGREILAAVLKLRKHLGGAAQDVQRAQVKAMGEQVAPVQQPTPQQGQNWQQAAKSMQAAQGIGQAA